MLDLQIQIFILLCIGYFLGKTGALSKKTTSQLNSLVMNLILPCSIAHSFQTDLSLEQFRASGVVLILSIAISLFFILVSRILYKKVKEDNERINLEYGTVANNSGTLGMVVSEAAFGQIGILYATIYALPVRVLMWSYGLSLYSLDQKSSLKDLVKKVALHPCMIAIYIGICLMSLQMYDIALPGFIQGTLNKLAACNTPMIMIVIGSVLSDIPLSSLFDKTALLYSGLRLIVYPAIILLACHCFSFPALPVSVCVLETAMPAPVTMTMLAAKYHKGEHFASKLVFVSTMLSIITLPLWTLAF